MPQCVGLSCRFSGRAGRVQALQNSAKAGGTHTRTREEAIDCFVRILTKHAFPHPRARGGTFAEFCKSPLWYPAPTRARYIVSEF